MKKSKRAKQKNQTLVDLPNDLLQHVVTHLPLKDNILASSVCKTLRDACVPVRVPDKSPWLIDTLLADGSYELHDISTQKTYTLKFPEISGFRVQYSKDGWLLMYNPRTFQLLFFNPFTRDCIPLPPLRMVPYVQRIAFSCAPTSTSCVLFTISYVCNSEYFTIKTCSPNAKEWNTFEFKNLLPEWNYSFKQIVFSNGVFYCLTNNSFLTSFNPSSSSWKIVPGRPPKHPGIERCYMTEHQGKIFLIYTYYNYDMKPRVFKLDRTSWKWTKKKTLGGLNIYISDLSCETRAEKKDPSGITDCLCFTNYDELERTCICRYYKVDVDEERVICDESSKQLDFYGHVWVIPPSNLLDLPWFDHFS